MLNNMKYSHLVLLAGSLLLSGCADWEQHMQDSLPKPQAAFEDKQINVSPTRSVFGVEYAAGKTQMSDNEKAYLSEFLDRTVQDDSRTVLLEQPGARADRLTRQRAAALGQWLTRSGYHVVVYTDVQPVDGQLQVAVDHLLAQVPNCPNWDVHPNFAFSANALPNLGCADHSNLAAMVANPRDLIVGEVPSAPSGHAPLRGEVNYRNGTVAPLQDAGSATSSSN